MEEAEAVQGAEAAARNRRWSKPTAAPAQAVEADAALVVRADHDGAGPRGGGGAGAVQEALAPRNSSFQYQPSTSLQKRQQILGHPQGSLAKGSLACHCALLQNLL